MADDASSLSKTPSPVKDLFLCHTGADKPWVEALAEKVESVPFDGRFLRVVFDKWDFTHAKNIVLELEREIDVCRFIGIVLSKASLAADWPTLERTIAVWSDPSGSKGRVIPILIENVAIPPTLRVRRWIDFRDPETFDASFLELIAVLRGENIPRGRGGLLPSLPLAATTPFAPVVITSMVEADKVQERLISNLLPVVELPSHVFGAPTTLRLKSDLSTTEGKPSPPPFLLRSGCLFSFDDLCDESSPFHDVIDHQNAKREEFRSWFGGEKQNWAIELLNITFKDAMYRRYLRFDKKGQRFFFTPIDGKPKRISWVIGGKRSTREVTTPHTATKLNDRGEKERIPFGWRHQGIRANFVLLPAGLFLRISPTWLLTTDGKSVRGGPRVGPILSQWLNQERNGQILRSLRFWSLVMSRNQTEIKISAGHQFLRIALSPATGDIGFGILCDTVDYDRLVHAEMDDDLEVPALVPEAEQLRLFSQMTGEPA
ncbi:MAG: toll/interleukin-1 receptor domain-containing protein [Acidobacteria bacterium]|nr:toll/interleukin-1 receptor domain-containing protein [Acidobacteriota bacterium]MBS1867230.1 toll/interleukin-1 receptor domain-containing protein [Acidobacteriota bacterium]